MKLTVADRHHWAPVPEVLAFLETHFGGKRVLDVGPGHCPLPWATDAVDFVDVPGVKNLVKCDLTREPLPFPNKSFDFVYCRHLLEDSWNPFPICAELARVGYAGYIETPSPLAELCRGVDGGAPHYRGYHHHRFIVWSHEGQLRFVSKYPLVEYLQFDEDVLVEALREGPKYWNTYHFWSGVTNPFWAAALVYWHSQSPLDFDVGRDYGALLNGGILQSRRATDAFWTNLPKPATAAVQNFQRAYG